MLRGQRRLKIRVTSCDYLTIQCHKVYGVYGMSLPYCLSELVWMSLAFLRPLAEVLWPGGAMARSEPESKAARNLGHDSLKFLGVHHEQ